MIREYRNGIEYQTYTFRTHEDLFSWLADRERDPDCLALFEVTASLGDNHFIGLRVSAFQLLEMLLRLGRGWTPWQVGCSMRVCFSTGVYERGRVRVWWFKWADLRLD